MPPPTPLFHFLTLEPICIHISFVNSSFFFLWEMWFYFLTQPPPCTFTPYICDGITVMWVARLCHGLEGTPVSLNWTRCWRPEAKYALHRDGRWHDEVWHPRLGQTSEVCGSMKCTLCLFSGKWCPMLSAFPAFMALVWLPTTLSASPYLWETTMKTQSRCSGRPLRHHSSATYQIKRIKLLLDKQRLRAGVLDQPRLPFYIWGLTAR